MPLRFPDVTDVPLRKSPLTEVICQVRFPPNLSIGQGVPANFQKMIRHQFPEWDETVEVGLFPFGNQENPPSRVFQFRSADAAKTVSLSVDAFSLSTTQYSSWGDFAKDLDLVHQAVQQEYEIPYAKRIGLRYVNQISSELTGLTTYPELQRLVRPELIAPLCTDAWNEAQEFILHLELNDGGPLLRFRTAAANNIGGGPTVILDFDYYEEGNLGLEALTDRCYRYHDVIYRAFRWSLTPDGFDILEPMSTEGS
jgi:uncharacterized protein (TIGR04255 family)